jgi:coenzyme F420-dependent glucose-6-phosphate dehydrogenase
MVELGYAMSSEEHTPNDLVKHAQRAEAAGFTFSLISDHYHPWIDAQGHAPFVWSVIGGSSQQTNSLRLGTGVTCPTIRIHPAIIAQAAATSATMMPGRFFLGVGTGEALNEHITGERWPSADERRDMLEEAIDLMRTLWRGGFQSYKGLYYQAEDARLYTLPDKPIEVMVAAAGPKSAELAGRAGDGLICTAPDAELVKVFEASGGAGKPRYGQFTCCWAASGAEATQTALKIWPTGSLPGELGQELPLPRHFEQAAQLVDEKKIAESVVLGPDPQPYLDKIKAWADAGVDHVYIHQIGPDQEGFFAFAEKELLPKVR